MVKIPFSKSRISVMLQTLQDITIAYEVTAREEEMHDPERWTARMAFARWYELQSRMLEHLEKHVEQRHVVPVKILSFEEQQKARREQKERER